MKKRNYKILLACVALGINLTFACTPLTAVQAFEEKNSTETSAPTAKESLKQKDDYSFNDEVRNTNKNDVNASIINKTPIKVRRKTPVTLGFKNTSNVDMDLSKVNMKYFYTLRKPSSSDEFTVDHAEILDSSTDLKDTVKSACNSYNFLNNYTNSNDAETCLSLSFNNKAGILKPGETLIFKGTFTSKENRYGRTLLQQPVLSYDGDSINGNVPEEYIEDSRILSNTVILDHTERQDTPVKMKVKTNVLKSIDLYTTKGTFLRTLEAGTDYVLNARNEVLLKKSFLDNPPSENATLDFKFSGGRDAVINIEHRNYGVCPMGGTLYIKNDEAIAFNSPDMPCLPGCSYDTWDNLTVPITIGDEREEEISNSTLILTFDKYLYKYVKVENLNTNKVTAEVDYNLGIIKVNLHEGTISPKESGPDFNIILQPENNVKAQEIKLGSIDDSLYKSKNEDTLLAPAFKRGCIDLLSIDGSLDFYTNSESGWQGKTVKIPLMVHRSKYFNLDSFDYSFKYDTNVFEDASLTPGDIIKDHEDLFTSHVDNEKGKIFVSYNLNNITSNKSDENKITKDGILMYITLKIKANAPLGLTSLQPISGLYTNSHYNFKDKYNKDDNELYIHENSKVDFKLDKIYIHSNTVK